MGESHQDGAGRARRRTPGPSTPGSAVLTPPTGLPAVSAPSVPQQRTAPEPAAPEPVRDAPPAPPATGVRMCTCGHPQDVHEHYRAGDDCGACGARTCASFTDRDDEAGPLRRAMRRLRG